MFRVNATNLMKLGIPFIVNTHVYQSMDLFSKQVLSGGSGIVYSASLTIMLSASKLDDKESDKAAEKKIGEFTKTGVLVTARPEKSRFTIPQKVQFQIPFFKAPNPYVGLESYLTWENSGIMRGQIITESEYNKLLESEKIYCRDFIDCNGKKMYARPKDTARSIIVRHLGKALPITDLWTKEVLTDEILDYLDEHVIRPNFELPSQDSMADIDEILDMENA